MFQSEVNEQLIQLLAQQEERLAQLYHQHALHFPNGDFWKNLSVEEEIHKQWVMTLAHSSENIGIKEDTFRIPALKTMLDFIEETKQKSKNFSLYQALGTSLNIEQALLEKNFFEVFETDSPSVKITFRNLAEATKAHVQRVEEELARVKGLTNI